MRAQTDGGVASGALGLAVTGLATRGGKLVVRERWQILEWACDLYQAADGGYDW